MTSNPQWFAEHERQYALDMERIENARARLDEWRKQLASGAKCVECELNLADPPSDLCPGCEACREHQADV